VKAWLEVARFAALSMLRTRAFVGLALITLAFPVVAWIFGSFFLVDIAKVHRDVFVALAQLTASAYLLLLALPALAADIEGGCLPELAPPMRRDVFLLGRVAGLFAAFVAWLFVLTTAALLLVALDRAMLEPFYREGTHWSFAFALSFVLGYQFFSLLAAIAAITAYASGRIEASVLGLGFFVLVWVLPPAIAALDNPEVARQVPALVQSIVRGVGWLFPPISTGELMLALARGDAGIVSWKGVAAHLGMHLAYAGAWLWLAVRWFVRRPL